MSHFTVHHASRPPTHIEAGALVAVNTGHLIAKRYESDPIDGAALAVWVPGDWLRFEEATKCPTCHQSVRYS